MGEWTWMDTIRYNLHRLFAFNGPLRWWFQNLKKEDNEKKLWNFRGSFRLHKYLEIQYSSWSGNRFSLGFRTDRDDGGYQFDFGLILFTVMITVCSRKFPLPKGYNDKEVGLRIHDWKIWLTIWEPTMEWSRSSRNYTFDILEFFFGHMTFNKVMIKESRDWKMNFPEGPHTVDFEFFNASWGRSRIPKWFPLMNHEQIRLNMTCKNGIPHPNKHGEDDNTYGLWCELSAATVEKAMDAVYENIYEDRSRHGSGPNMYRDRKTNEAQTF